MRFVPFKAEIADLGVCNMFMRIMVSVVLAPLFFIMLVLVPPLYLAVLISAICAMAAFELLRATKVPHHRGIYICTVAAAAVIAVSRGFSFFNVIVQITALALLASLFLIAIRQYGSQNPFQIEQLLLCLLGGVLIPVLLSALISLRNMEHGQYLVLLPVICAFTTDAGAYFVGMSLGKHRGILKVSPNKSLEGFVGGILFGAVFMLLYGMILSQFAHLPVRLERMVVYGLFGGAMTELGDLSFSLIKRQFGVKDYGHLLPGHGGMLDRFDSMIFAAPLLLLLVDLFPPF